MTTIIKNLVIASCICGGVFSASAQSQDQIDYIKRNSDLTTVEALIERFDKQYHENYQKALELARQNNWPLTINNPDGSFSELQGVFDDGSPKYYKTSNRGSAITSRVNKIQPGGTAGLSLDGTGMLAAVWDAGKPRLDHVDLVGRIDRGDNSNAAVATHSTHVMGTIISSGIDARAKGMAFKANALWADWNNDLKEMGDAVKNKGLLVSNHSYGLDAGAVAQNLFGAYNQAAADIDALLFASPFYQPCWAAGNDRDNFTKYNPSKLGHDLLLEEACAKNVMVVAAVNEVLSYTNANSVKMSLFSNWGPTDDNRIKPDISAKGVDVYSTWTTSTTSYNTISGTSMATPGVVGALVLLQQHYGNVNKPAAIAMRSATLRGLVAHTADEAGTTSATSGISVPGPDSKFGWGLLNAERAAKAITDTKTDNSIINELTLTQGETYTRTVVATGTEPLIATISWTDRAGVANPNGGVLPALVNDLDITVTKDGVTTKPWKLNKGLDDAATRGDNHVDNIEKIEVPNTVQGVYTITVTHQTSKALVGDSQDYSLIVTGIDQAQLGVGENDFKEFNVWPNPANDLLNVSIQSDLASDANVTLYDVQGRRVVDQKLDASNVMFSGSLNIGFLNPGIYLVKVSQGDKQSVRKIIKK